MFKDKRIFINSNYSSPQVKGNLLKIKGSFQQQKILVAKEQTKNG